VVHASIWEFCGEPDELLRRYDAMVAAIPPASMRLHLCLRARDGIVVVDTCPSEAAFAAFAPRFAELRAQSGLPEPERVDDFPVHVALLDGRILPDN
jgi:hypothetical protein